MHKALSVAVFAGLVLHLSAAYAQIVTREKTFHCGTIGPSPSGGSMLYDDLGHGFRFEFPSGWAGSWTSLDNPAQQSAILVAPLLAAKDPRFYVSEGAKATGEEVINGLEWTALAWPDGRRGYYVYRDGVGIEFVAIRVGKSRTPTDAVFATLRQILSSLSFSHDSFRIDLQLAALRTGQKMGSLTIRRMTAGKGGFDGAISKIEFAGRLTLTGTVQIESTMGGSNSGYFMSGFDSESRKQIPQLKCPPEEMGKTPRLQVVFRNQDFAEEQFGKNTGQYEAHATVVVDSLSEAFYSAGSSASVRARLVAIVDKTPPQ